MDISSAKAALKKYFGYDNFRPMQADIIENILQKQDCVVLMPTGGGKSICYQIPSVILPGCSVVVSPLISLMKDQVEGLRSNGIKASFLNSSLNSSEQRLVEEEFFQSQIDLLYVSPEKLLSQEFFPLLKRANVNLFAIDEAHCISSWGHDFRPEYTQLGFLKRQFPDIPVVALTATADKITRRDIMDKLQLEDPQLFIASFDRPNLSLEVRPGQKRLEQILAFIAQRPKDSGIIYCLSRKRTEEMAAKLNDRGFRAAHYHAGMSPADRDQVQEDFINDNIPIICATIAFGMGIDKSNVRWIIHYNLPKNIEGYYQEIGRAGRDGAKAATLLFYSFADVSLMQDIIQKNESENTEVQLAKLERMQQYAESLACRRRILLNYFGEDLNENCGNCDICKNPPEYIDGTVIAQKALSAVYRLKEQVGVNMLINVLRASGRREIMERGYDKIKTYGAGRDIPFVEWRDYMHQLINLGYLEVAHDQHNVLKLTPASKRALFDQEAVQLVKMTTVKERLKAEKAKAKASAPKSTRQRTRDELFEELRQLRKRLAQERGIPPYLVFSDATLEEMSATRAMNDLDMQRVSGVGQRKLQLYGDEFQEAIRDYVRRNSNHISGSTVLVTYDFYKENLSIEEIARERNLSPATVYSHLEELIKNGYEVDIYRYISKEEAERVWKSRKYVEQPARLKDLYELMNREIPYEKIRLALAYSK
ncbi:DNA helicase RecQ [Flavilitoribacter nigricans]|uniref:DNA helicase RecQ n=1 Tax=Flavilitoribacter nigricans (strain ATCC 23147 / DSM 23189 / NBRC 102662 / NCIMB 1420 / SS-2) TaxID=1122177 RepID=A0A2D0N2Z6_FLAN2|nr:DNA helicase RecQ [Flavilitoribacter nigricans]PHN02827.1 DNA helicase RecQ [Flavilitoribacter nigricans DSM 23189 = NBRC 102662]